MQLHSKAPLRCAFPLRRTTYTRTGGFCLWANPDFQRMARRNPPVLLPLERLCSARKHPLSSGSGRQRYNTLDLASKIVCHETAGFIGFFLPRRALPSIGCLPPRQRCRLWKPLPRERCPFGIPARFEMSTHKLEHGFVDTHFKTQKTRASSFKKIMSWDFWCHTYGRPQVIRAPLRCGAVICRTRRPVLSRIRKHVLFGIQFLQNGCQRFVALVKVRIGKYDFAMKEQQPAAVSLNDFVRFSPRRRPVRPRPRLLPRRDPLWDQRRRG